jgi:hypothetical protein
MILPKTIILTHVDTANSTEVRSYAEADEVVQKWVATVDREERQHIRTVVVFTDLFVWSSSLSVSREDSTAAHFVQRAIQADWEFNAGVRPAWWPHGHESDRIWGVHYREDRDNGRAELARMRLERYDLQPMALSELPPRDAQAMALKMTG